MLAIVVTFFHMCIFSFVGRRQQYKKKTLHREEREGTTPKCGTPRVTKTSPSWRGRRHDATAVWSDELDLGFPQCLKRGMEEAMEMPSRRRRHPHVSPLPALEQGFHPSLWPNNPKCTLDQDQKMWKLKCRLALLPEGKFCPSLNEGDTRRRRTHHQH